MTTTRNPNVPSLSLLVDQLTVRIEWAEAQGLEDERRALTEARAVVLRHVFREARNVSLLDQIRARLLSRFAA